MYDFDEIVDRRGSGSLKWDVADDELHDGYYREIAMTANGEFIPKGKLSDSEVQKAGLVYKVEMDKEKKDQVKKITTRSRAWQVRHWVSGASANSVNSLPISTE